MSLLVWLMSFLFLVDVIVVLCDVTNDFAHVIIALVELCEYDL